VAPALAAHAVRRGLSVLAPRQTPGRAHKNIAHHYDLDEAFYRLFLDDDLQYTCAYFERPDVTLEQAQLAKKRHIASKLALEEDQRVLDIGSGWGGLCLYLAEAAGVRAHGVTLSEAQYRVAQRRVEERGLADRVSFELCDYRRVQGAFDRIVSVGMFEAIGKKEIENFFVTAARLLEKRGVVLLHSIGRTRKRAVQNPWLEKYIFPGSYIPALSEVLPSVERAGFIVTDLEILRLHYAYTLREWRRRFVANQQRVIEIYDARFFRMWEFYLAASEAGFRIDRMFIFQLQLARHQDAVPLTRSYMAEAEQELSKREDRLYGR
jgi:cyclopropane-fatty-acyl-phospholipid synthase